MAEINSVDIDDFTQLNSKMPYLDAIIMEINRLHPTVHATLRVINRDVTLTSGKKPYDLKAGMLIYLSYLHLHTSKEFWGDDADVFVPERFLGGKKSENGAFMSFGYGPRNCVSLAVSMHIPKLTPVGRIQIRDYCCQDVPRYAPQDLSFGCQGT